MLAQVASKSGLDLNGTVNTGTANYYNFLKRHHRKAKNGCIKHFVQTHILAPTIMSRRNNGKSKKEMASGHV